MVNSKMSGRPTISSVRVEIQKIDYLPPLPSIARISLLHQMTMQAILMILQIS
jgi:hypothetical protein